MPHPTKETRSKCHDAVKRLKFGSPKLSEVLRARRKYRINEARSKSFDNCRQFEYDAFAKALDDIVKEELEEDEELRKLIIQELLSEEELWLFDKAANQELESIIQHDLDANVWCPICQKALLKITKEGYIKCACGLSLLRPSLFNFQSKLSSILSVHSQLCEREPEFGLESGENAQSLVIMCSECNFLDVC